MSDVKKAAILPTCSNAGMAEWKMSNIFPILQLPNSILMDILSALPMKTVMSCRCVCKKFLFIISDSYFAKFHLSRSPISILIKTLPRKNESKRLQVAQLLEKGGEKFQFEKMKFTLKNNLPSCDITNACNGLLCFYGFGKEDAIYVCNPILGEYITIPPACRGRKRTDFGGLGYNPITDQYKVIQTFYPSQESTLDDRQSFIYTIGTGVWRSLGDGPRDYVDWPFNSFLNGALHWTPCGGNNSELIWSFDFDSEQFKPLPPPEFAKPVEGFADFSRVGVLEGCLYLVLFEDTGRFDIWVMKEYGVKESWSKQFVIRNLYLKGFNYDFYEPMLILRNGEILFYLNREIVVCYNHKNKYLRETKISGTLSEFIAVAYTPCFVSLFHVAKGEESKIKRIRGKRERKSATVTAPTA